MKTAVTDCRKCREAIQLRLCGEPTADEIAAIESHLTVCDSCQTYERDLRTLVGNMRHLATRPVAPNPEFHRRWTSAVRGTDRGNPWVETVAAGTAWIREFLWRNRRLLAGLSPAWVLIVALRMSAPDAGSVPAATRARSPIEIFLSFRVEDHILVANDRQNRAPVPVKPPAAVPRSDRTTARPLICRSEFEPKFPQGFLS